jgi:hypothetical protein
LEDPDLLRRAAFVTGLYNRARENCLKYCYLASRSYKFWSLEPDSNLYAILKLGSPHNIDHAVLAGVEQELFNDRNNEVLKQLSQRVQHFPSKTQPRPVADAAGT